MESKDIVDNIFGELESVMRIVKYPRTLPNGKIRVETIRGYMIMHEDYETIKKKYRDMIRKEADNGKPKRYKNVGMSVEDRIYDMICDGCDQDPAMCYNQGYCEYDKEEIVEDDT